MIVSDFFHWEYLGDWSFYADEWPDPAAMVSELKSMGTELMVSVWPSVSPLSANYKPMLDRGLLISSEQSPPVHATWPERGVKSWIGVAFYDSTNPAARDYIWEQVEKNYYRRGDPGLLARRLRTGDEARPSCELELRGRGRSRGCKPLPPRACPRVLRRHGRVRRGRSAPAVPVCLGRQPALWRGSLVG